MTDFSASRRTGLTYFVKEPGFSVREAYWGYIITSGRRPMLGIVLAQFGSFLLGAFFLSVALSMVVMPTVFLEGELGPMRIGAAVFFAAIAFYLLWYASRGTDPELHIDTKAGEVREVISNHAGRPTTVGCYRFDAIGGVFMERHPSKKIATLVLRYRNTSQTICVAVGEEAQLISLRDRLGQDLMIRHRGR